MLKKSKAKGTVKPPLGTTKKPFFFTKRNVPAATLGISGNKTGIPWMLPLEKIGRFFPEKKGESRRSKAERRRKTGYQLARCVILAVAVAALLLALKGPAARLIQSLEFFYITEIRVTGCSMTRAADIKAASGYDYNMSIFSFSPREVEKKLGKYPWIKSASVKRIWPGEIEISIHENRAAAIMIIGEPGQEKMVYVDTSGSNFAPVRPGDDHDYPVLTGLNVLPDQPRKDALKEGTEFLRLLGRNDPNLPAQLVSEIFFDPVEGMVVRLVDYTFPIYFGRGQIKEKYIQLKKIMAVLYKKKRSKVAIDDIKYIRMDYSTDKVLVARSNSG